MDDEQRNLSETQAKIASFAALNTLRALWQRGYRHFLKLLKILKKKRLRRLDQRLKRQRRARRFQEEMTAAEIEMNSKNASGAHDKNLTHVPHFTPHFHSGLRKVPKINPINENAVLTRQTALTPLFESRFLKNEGKGKRDMQFLKKQNLKRK